MIKMDEKTAVNKIRAGRFIKNNGKVLRTINIMRYKFEKLSEVHYALDDMPENEYFDSLNYLFEAGYIQIRHIRSRQPAVLADEDIEQLEAKLTDKGIRLLAGRMFDELVEV